MLITILSLTNYCQEVFRPRLKFPVTSVPALCVVRCQEYRRPTLRHASLNRAILETCSSGFEQTPMFGVDFSAFISCAGFVRCHVYHVFMLMTVHAYRYKKLGYATRGVPYVSCSRIFQSRIFHPLLYGADISSPAFSSLAFSASPLKP